MFICKSNCSFACFVLNLNVILSSKLHNLLKLYETSKIITKYKRIKFVPRRVIMNFNPNAEQKQMDRSNFNTWANSHPSTSGAPSTANRGNSNTGSITFMSRSDDEALVLNPVNYFMNQNVVGNNMPQHYMQMQQQAMYMSNYVQGVNLINYQTSRGHSFYHSFSDFTHNKKLNGVYFNSRGNDASNVPKVTSQLNRAKSTSRHSNVVRTWKQTPLGKILDKRKGSGKNPGRKLKIMSYNVLAQNLLMEHPQLYQQHEPKALKWSHRWRLLFDEIKEHDCDIICLQEVQIDHIENYFNVLKLLGYKGIYKQRTGIRTDGCAIYYKKSVFHLVEHIDVEFNQPNITLLDRDNVAIIAKFAPKDQVSSEFVVATTHLLYNPRRLDVRLAQMQVLLTEIGRIAHKAQQNNPEYTPVIITGDLNSTPDTPLYQFIKDGILKYENLELRRNYGMFGKVLLPPLLRITDTCQHADLMKQRQSATRKISRNEELKFIKLRNSRQPEVVLEKNRLSIENHFSTGTIAHPFKLTSVYNHIVNDDNEGTTYQSEWVTVDYIFYSGCLDKSNKFRDDKLKLLSYYSLPTSQELYHVRIPNLELGSDHLALVAKFKLEY